MKRRLLIAGAFLVAVAAGLINVRPALDSGDREQGRSQGSGGLARPVDRSSAKSGRERAAPVDPARRLRQIIMAGPAEAPRFAAVEKLVTRLSEAELAALRAESAQARADSLGGWVRCAVHAELARRDPETALEWLTSSLDLSDYDGWGYRQIWFSTFRGWAERDPVAALAGLGKYASSCNRTGRVMLPSEIGDHDDYIHFISRDDTWRLQAAAEIFAQHARVDPEVAWAAVPEEVNITGQRDAALEGFFRGLQGGDDVRVFVARWGVGLHAVELFLESAIAGGAMGPRISNPGARPRRETITVQAALSLEAVQPGAGREWFRGANSGGITVEQRAQAAFFDGFARGSPERALAVLEDDTLAGSTLLGAFLRHHPDRAAEAFALVDDPNERYEETLSAISNAAFLRLEDLFPAPGRSNRLPDWHQRYEDLLLVVDAGGFDPEQEANLVRLVSEQFAPVIPEARTAGGLPNERE